jgi:hypothetical protein
MLAAFCAAWAGEPTDPSMANTKKPTRLRYAFRFITASLGKVARSHHFSLYANHFEVKQARQPDGVNFYTGNSPAVSLTKPGIRVRGGFGGEGSGLR